MKVFLQLLAALLAVSFFAIPVWLKLNEVWPAWTVLIGLFLSCVVCRAMGWLK